MYRNVRGLIEHFSGNNIDYRKLPNDKKESDRYHKRHHNKKLIKQSHENKVSDTTDTGQDIKNITDICPDEPTEELPEIPIPLKIDNVHIGEFKYSNKDELMEYYHVITEEDTEKEENEQENLPELPESDEEYESGLMDSIKHQQEQELNSYKILFKEHSKFIRDSIKPTEQQYNNLLEICRRHPKRIERLHSNSGLMRFLYSDTTPDKLSMTLTRNFIKLIKLDDKETNVCVNPFWIYVIEDLSIIVKFPRLILSHDDTATTIAVIKTLMVHLFGTIPVSFTKDFSLWINFLDFFRKYSGLDERVSTYYLIRLKQYDFIEFNNFGYFRLLSLKEYTYDVTLRII